MDSPPVKRGPGRPRNPPKVPKLSPFTDTPKARQYLSRESVRNIETLALRKVRHALTQRGIDASDLM